MQNSSMLAQGSAAPSVTGNSPAFFIVAGLASMGVFLVALELTIVAVALPAIGQDLQAAQNPALAWVFSGYNIAVAALLLVFGWLADRYGRRAAFVSGLVVFAVGCTLSGIAQSLPLLVTGRVIQGVGGAMMMPASLALLLALIDAAQRNRAIALWGASAGLAAALGPVLGGAIIHSVGWRGVFLVNVPVALLIAGLAVSFLPESKAENDQQGLAGPTGPVPNPLRYLLRLSSFTWASIASFPLVAGFTAWVVLAPGFLHVVWNYPLEQAGLAIVPAPLMMVITAAPAARLADRIGHRFTICAGSLIAALALIWWYLWLTPEPGYVGSFLPGALLFGSGLGLAFPMLAAAAVRDVCEEHYAFASAGLTTVRQLAMAAGSGLAIVWINPSPASPDVSGIDQIFTRHQTVWAISAGLLVLTAAMIQKIDSQERKENNED